MVVQLTFAQQRHIFQLIGHTFFRLDTCRRRLWQTPDKGITRPFLLFSHFLPLKGPKKGGNERGHKVTQSHMTYFQLACHNQICCWSEKVDNNHM